VFNVVTDDVDRARDDALSSDRAIVPSRSTETSARER
jgi:hypothetical protein